MAFLRLRFSLGLALALGVTAVSRPAAADIFDNATRRDPTAAEIARVGRIQQTCTMFFLENTANTVYAVTARHCFDQHNINTWCEIDGTFSTADQPRSNNGQCLQVIATDSKHDIAVFEARVDEPLTGPLFRLASYTPAENTKLGITGYPSDPERNGAITTTTNCWILGTAGSSPFPDDARMQDRSIHHNCSVWGGNSGGPVWADGTRDVIGLPFNYHQDDSDDDVLSSTDESDAPSIALMSDFVQVHGNVLAKAGIKITSTPSTSTSVSNGESLTGDDDDDANGISSPGATKGDGTSATRPEGETNLGCAMSPSQRRSSFAFPLFVLAITALRRRRSRPAK